MLRRLAMASDDLGGVHSGCLGCDRPRSWRKLCTMDLGDRNERIRKRLGFRGFAGNDLLTNGRHHLPVRCRRTRRARSSASGAGVEANRPDAGRETGPAGSDMYPGDAWTQTRTNTPTRSSNPHTRRQLTEKPISVTSSTAALRSKARGLCAGCPRQAPRHGISAANRGPITHAARNSQRQTEPPRQPGSPQTKHDTQPPNGRRRRIPYRPANTRLTSQRSTSAASKAPGCVFVTVPAQSGSVSYTMCGRRTRRTERDTYSTPLYAPYRRARMVSDDNQCAPPIREVHYKQGLSRNPDTQRSTSAGNQLIRGSSWQLPVSDVELQPPG